MKIYEMLLIPVFQMLEQKITIPLDITGTNKVEIPIYLIICIIFIINLIDIIYNRIFDNGD